MGKKGKGKKGKGKKAQPVNLLHEVDKQFYELEIDDINRKITRLSLLSITLERGNAELERNYQKMDEEKADIINSLKRTLTDKQAEFIELKEAVKAAQKDKAARIEEQKKQVEGMKENFEEIRAELTADIKMSTGKLNSLEDFRLQREELFGRYDDLQKYIDEQEIKHKRLLYDLEKKFISGKDRIKKEVEKEIYKIATKFEGDNEIRVAPTTQRVIHENTAINNEIIIFATTNSRLERENYEIQGQSIQYEQKCKQFTAKCTKALNDSFIQKGTIECLSNEYRRLALTASENQVLVLRAKECERDLNDLLQKEKSLSHTVRKLEQTLHAVRSAELMAKTKSQDVIETLNSYRNVLKELILVLKNILRLEKQQIPAAEKIEKYNTYYGNILTVLEEVENEVIVNKQQSVETLRSVTSVYAKGDLGFIPKIHKERRPPPEMINATSEMGKSFESLVNAQHALERLLYEEMMGEMEEESELTTEVSEPEPERKEHYVKEEDEEEMEIDETVLMRRIEFGKSDESYEEDQYLWDHKELLKSINLK